MARMKRPSQTNPKRAVLALLAALAALPCLAEANALLWGARHGYTGRALRDGLDFWAGATLPAQGRLALLFDPAAYNRFLQQLYGPLPTHLWSYPPNYLLLTRLFTGLTALHATLAFEAASLLLLATLLRLAGQSWWLVAAVAASPAALENLLSGQNAALLTALIGGGLLLLPRRPILAGALIGLASIKPQLGLVLPLNLFRRSPPAFFVATLTALALAAAALLAFGPAAWLGFWRVTRPAMSAVLLTGQPRDFAAGLTSVFALAHPLGIPTALLAQATISTAAIACAARTKNPAAILILAALASPYLHNYDLLGATLAVALLLRDRLAQGFTPGEPALFLLAWATPGLLPWLPHLAPFTPILLALLLASALSRGSLAACDSDPSARASSAGRSAIPARPASTANG